jgi:hypothetical protein
MSEDLAETAAKDSPGDLSEQVPAPVGDAL